MRLPTKSHKEGFKLNNLRSIFYGPPGIGKSTLASLFDNVMFIDTHRGLKALDVYSVSVGSWEDVRETVEEFVKGKHQFDNIVLDVADDIFKFCGDYLSKKYKIEHPSDAQYGKGWDLLKTEFNRILLRLASSSYGIILISHSKEYEITRRHVKLTRTGTTLPTPAQRIVYPFVDIIGYCGFTEVVQNGKSKMIRTITLEASSDEIESKDRTNTNTPSYITMPKNKREFEEYFGKYFE